MLVLAAGIACDHDATSPIPEPTRERLLESVTPDVALAVGGDGRFQLVSPVNTGRPQITGQQAADLAMAVAKFNISTNPSRVNEERGAIISFARLFPCQAPLYAAAAFQRLEIDDATQAAHPLQKGIGPFWLVRLCGSDGPELNIAVSAYSTDLGIRPDGGVEFPAIGGGDFLAQGIPALREKDELPSAESAVVLVAGLSGRLIAAVPELITPFFRNGEVPQDARWHLHLDAPTKLRTTAGQLLETQEVYVSRIRAGGSRIWVATSIQPDFGDVVFVPMTFVGEKYEDYLKREAAETRTLHAVRLRNVPINFTAAAIEK